MSEFKLPGTRAATTLEVFGLPNIAILPSEVTSARWSGQGGDHIRVVCGGVEIKLELLNPTIAKHCFNWLIACMNSRPTN